MSKSSLKKHLQSLTQEQIIEVILEAYGNSKAVQEYFDFYLKPDDKEKAKKYKAIIEKEFGVKNPMKAGLKFSVAKKAISEFASFKPSPETLADVMLTLPEAACWFTYEFGDMDEPFYNAAHNNFKRAVEFIHKHGLLDKFKKRCNDCVMYASPCGYGFADEIAEVFYEYYGEDATFVNKYGDKS
ncbi:DUF6155 family protein [Proteiniphilum sp. X52]|uniref:DUF6155 family protein n=1 Tax=Proteiniphilum sp. X52 TaxID=2382159 RepID=UPI000F09AC48|nr:DUF6155 family protein [Proteiniphilum sp. X52]RNC64143.1 hypothetical protein D7D25_13070 [Proteiniphilum sp. X52]